MVRRARQVQSCETCSVVSTNVFHYGHSNGEENGVYTISSGESGNRIMLSVVVTGNAAVNGKMVTASEG